MSETAEPAYPARYFDGESATAHPVDVVIASDGLHWRVAAASSSLIWPYKKLRAETLADGDIRIQNKTMPDASLILPAAAMSALLDRAPFLVSARAQRRRFAMLVGSLVAAAGLMAAVLFIGVPAASGPLAQATPKEVEQRIGENVSGQIGLILTSCKFSDGEAKRAFEQLEKTIDEMGARAEVGFPINFRFVRSAVPNAFALPGGQVAATSGLLDAVGEDQEAFLAVIAHELGHVRNRDSMQAIYRNAGLSTLLEIVTGGSGVAQQLILVGGQLSQLSHSRAQEAAADEVAFEIMALVDLDPAALARAFEAIRGTIGDTEKGEDEDEDDFETPVWLSSHPDTDARIEKARAAKREAGAPPLSDEEWRLILDNTCA